MKMYTNSEQTAKLIELGFEKPCSIASVEPIYGMGGISVAKAYSIGELLSFLPKEIYYNGFNNTLHIFVNQVGWNVNQVGWNVEYSDFLGELYSVYRAELIDALYDMILRLKEEGVI